MWFLDDLVEMLNRDDLSREDREYFEHLLRNREKPVWYEELEIGIILDKQEYLKDVFKRMVRIIRNIPEM